MSAISRIKVMCLCNLPLVQVFGVDFGDVFGVSSSNIRLIKDQFLILPFQVVECFVLDNCSSSGSARLFLLSCQYLLQATSGSY